MKDDDDYTLMERDFEEFMRRGLEERKWERKDLFDPMEHI